MRKLTLSLAIATLLLAHAGGAEAQGHIELSTLAEQEILIVDESGEEQTKRVAATKVLPGDEVIYTIRARNISDEPADRIVITDPIPQHMTYTPGTATGMHTEVRFSADGGESYAFAADLVVIDADGEPRAAVAEDYTHIRWHFQVSLGPGQDQTVQFRAKLN